jgi:GntR family transcriptional regulator
MRVILSNSSSEPIYEQIARQVRTQIFAGELEEGTLLSSIRSLAQDLQVSVITTKRAYGELEREGLIDTIGGKGTFVAAQNPQFLREKRISLVEKKLAEAVSEARLVGLSLDDLAEMVQLLAEED